MISIISKALERGALNSVRVFIDGMIKSINPVYENAGRLDVPDQFVYVRDPKIGYDTTEVIDYCLKNPSIIVTSSGMMSGGPVVEYARHMLSDGRNRLLLPTK